MGDLFTMSYLQDLLTGPIVERPLCKISWSPGISGFLAKTRTPFFTRPPREISVQRLLISLGLLARPLWEIPARASYKASWKHYFDSMRNLYTTSPGISGSPDRASEGDLYTRPPGSPGPPNSLHRSSLQDLFTRPLWGVSKQDFFQPLDLLARPPWEISLQEIKGLHERSLSHELSSQDL